MTSRTIQMNSTCLNWARCNTPCLKKSLKSSTSRMQSTSITRLLLNSIQTRATNVYCCLLLEILLKFKSPTLRTTRFEKSRLPTTVSAAILILLSKIIFQTKSAKAWTTAGSQSQIHSWDNFNTTKTGSFQLTKTCNLMLTTPFKALIAPICWTIRRLVRTSSIWTKLNESSSGRFKNSAVKTLIWTTTASSRIWTRWAKTKFTGLLCLRCKTKASQAEDFNQIIL